MKHLIMGTAGHVDHGKTALVRALTGIECDTHKEEKERGITIHLGFAHLTRPNGDRIGIIDVPGHRDFVHTMVGGASGIDFVLLVIAADNGVMPQTREHLQIMEILGIKQGIIVLTKVDLVDADLLEICELDVQEFLTGTFLANAPVVKVSAKTGTGIGELKQAIEQMAERIKPRAADGVFRLYLDRFFSVSGFGTVVTGTVIGGCIKKDDTLYLQGPSAKELRVRRLERHGEEVASVQAGDRASLNLVGLDRADCRRGMLLSDRILKETALIDATLAIHAPKGELGLWSTVVLHAGTFEKQAKVHLIDKNRLCAGETGLVQIHLDEPAFLQHGDRFVVRNSSCDLTIGGGEVIDASPLHHRRRPERLVTELELVAKNKLHELISLEVRKAQKPITVEEIAERLHASPGGVAKVIESEVLTGIVSFATKEGQTLVSQIALETLRGNLLTMVGDYRRRNPLSANGIDLDELRSLLHLEQRPANDEVILATLQALVVKQKLREHHRTWLLADDTGMVDPKLARNVNLVEAYLKGCGMQVPLPNQIKALADQEGIGEKELRGILHHLTTAGKVLKIEGEYLHHSVVDDCRSKLIAFLQGKPDGMKVSDFRDLINGNRKICLLLLARFDAEGLTVRNGDFRFLKTAPAGPTSG